MTFEEEKNSILQPHSWETIIALELRRPLEELTSTPVPTALHATARAFILNTYQKPTLYSTKHLAECVSTYNHRLERWQARLAKLREEQQDLLDDLEEQEAALSVQTNAQLSTLAFLQQRKDYHAGLLLFAQKSSDDTTYLCGKIPANLAVRSQRESMAKLLSQHGVVYTPQSIVATLRKLVDYYRLQIYLYFATKKAENCAVPGYRDAEISFHMSYAPNCPVLPEGPLREDLYVLFKRDFPSQDEIISKLVGITFTKQELEELDAWTALQEDFFEVAPFPLPQQDEVLLAEVVAQPSAPASLALPEPKPLTLNPQKKFKLPKIQKRTTLSNVCKFFYSLSQDPAFATVPTTSQGVKALMDKLFTQPFTQLYSSLNKGADIELAVQYNVANKLLGDFFTKFQEKECEAQTRQGLDEIAAFGRTDSLVQEDPAKDYRTEPQDAVAYLNNFQPAEEDWPSQEEIIAQIRAIQERHPDGLPRQVYDEQIAPLNEKLCRRQALDRKRTSGKP